MLRKILIPSLIIGFFIIAIVSPVSAVDKTLEDDLEDVIDMVESTDIDEVYTDEKPNIDIHKIYYTKDGTSVTITMEMNDDGVIENRGNIDNPEALDMVSYLCALTMEGAEVDYEIIYINESVTLNEEEEGISYSIDGNKITFNFEVESASEVYSGIYAATVDSALESALSFYMFADEFSDLEQGLSCSAGGPYSGKPGDTIEFEGAASGGFKPYTWYWDFGDDETSEVQNPTHTYDESGNYQVTLTVADGAGNTCERVVTAQISSNGNDDDSEGNIMIFLAIIAVVVIAGIAVLAVFLRR
jgi:hypothetical protein